MGQGVDACSDVGNVKFRDHLGIIVNSSFSWWGAWLQNDRGKIIAPNPWFGPSASDLDTSDVIPDRWEIIDWSFLE